MTFWTLDNLAAVTAGRWSAAPGDASAVAAGLTIDSRAIEPGQVFLAIAGERFDGHDFVDDALAAGAVAAVVLRADAVTRGPALVVDDTLAALQTLASAYRDRLAACGCKVVAVAGSNGKTTTRHLIHAALTGPGSGLTGTQSPKSFNNHIGVPLTLLAAGEGDDFVVVEVGTNHPGEVAALAAIARPDVGVITSIGEEHLEFFGSVEAVEAEEFSLFDHLAAGGRAVTFRDVAAYDGPLSLLGRHNRANAGLAAAVASHLGVSAEAVAAGLAAVQPVAGRLRRVDVGGVTVLDDTYNANPSSVREALAVLGAMPGARRVAVLGDMFELGEASAEAHRAIAREAAAAADVLVLVGAAYAEAAEAAGVDAAVYRDSAAAAAWVDAVAPGDVVLLKGSRGMRMERVLTAIEAR